MKLFSSVNDVADIQSLVKEALQLKQNPYAYQEGVSLEVMAKAGLAAARLGCHRVTPIVHYDKITEPHKQPEPAVVSPTGP